MFINFLFSILVCDTFLQRLPTKMPQICKFDFFLEENTKTCLNKIQARLIGFKETNKSTNLVVLRGLLTLRFHEEEITNPEL